MDAYNIKLPAYYNKTPTPELPTDIWIHILKIVCATSEVKSWGGSIKLNSFMLHHYNRDSFRVCGFFAETTARSLLLTCKHINSIGTIISAEHEVLWKERYRQAEYTIKHCPIKIPCCVKRDTYTILTHRPDLHRLAVYNSHNEHLIDVYSDLKTFSQFVVFVPCKFSKTIKICPYNGWQIVEAM
jgi:hypothetical protein